MTSHDDLKTTIRRNKLLGMWAAEKLGLTGAEADSYSQALAMDTLHPQRDDAFRKIRKDFDVAGVAQSDEQILHVIYEFTIQAADPNQAKSGGGDAAAVMLARNLSRRP